MAGAVDDFENRVQVANDYGFGYTEVNKRDHAQRTMDAVKVAILDYLNWGALSGFIRPSVNESRKNLTRYASVSTMTAFIIIRP